jgi:hypothetical protein
MISKCIDILEVDTNKRNLGETSLSRPVKKPKPAAPVPLQGGGYPVYDEDAEDTEEAEFVFGFNPLPSDSLE